jgi:hypothetical protein
MNRAMKRKQLVQEHFNGYKQGFRGCEKPPKEIREIS